jgi:hypothetical protein
VPVGTDAHRPSIDTEGATFEHTIAIDASLIYWVYRIRVG